MDIDLSKFINVTITDDQMTAYIYISSRTADSGDIPADSLTPEMLRDFLSSRGVKAGIDKNLLQQIIINKLFDRQHVIAQGQPPVNGVDGRILPFGKGLGVSQAAGKAQQQGQSLSHGYSH